MEQEEKDVELDSSTDTETEEDKVVSESDKDKNFAELRKQLKDKDAEIERLKQGEERELKKVDSSNEVSKVLFDRDMKKATRKWNAEHQVSAEEWQKIKANVSLKGDEDDEEIYKKISDAYESMPEVKKKREQDLIEQGKKEALKQFSDEEVDIGAGGEAPESKQTTRISERGKKILDVFGVSEKEIIKE